MGWTIRGHRVLQGFPFCSELHPVGQTRFQNAVVSYPLISRAGNPLYLRVQVLVADK